MKEIWKDVVGYEGLYKVSSFGGIKSVSREEIYVKYGKMVKRPRKETDLVKFVTNCGYVEVALCKKGKPKRISLHRLIGQAFIPNPDGKPQINHKDGNKQNNYASNLEWVTARENQLHASINGLKLNTQGELNHLSKLNEVQVRIIRHLFKEMKVVEIASYFGVTSRTIYSIKAHKIWKHVA